jgi:Zn-dependent peptidase ImmA (M78 family)/DNA-binding XRE family transcriptional regulator
MFNPRRLTLARRRRGLSEKQLAIALGVTTRALTAYEAGEYPPADEVLNRIARVLDFPLTFFFGDDLEEPDAKGASFRSMKRMTAGQRHSALAAGAIALEVSKWVDTRFKLPTPDLPDLSGEEPEAAAAILRQEWGLGELSIRNMVHLLEAKGVRVFSLLENTREIDAFSLWNDRKPFVFLNTIKSAVRSRFDAAHELAHLILHNHGPVNGRDVEREADVFASSFLMPRSTILAVIPKSPTLADLRHLKNKWLVSIAALARRIYYIGLISEWHYRTICIQISERGWRTSEPDDALPETSRVWEKVLSMLRQEGVSKDQIAHELAIPPSEIDKLVWGLVTIGLASPVGPVYRSARRATDLRLYEN